jgi:hypothetical protein
MTYSVVFSPEAAADLLGIYHPFKRYREGMIYA